MPSDRKGPGSIGGLRRVHARDIAPQLNLAPSSRGWQAVALLRRAAAPERSHLIRAVFWLVIAAALEVLGPILGKALIDDHLLSPR